MDKLQEPISWLPIVTMLENVFQETALKLLESWLSEIIKEKQFQKAVFMWLGSKKLEKERLFNTQISKNKILREWPKILVYMKKFKNQLLLVFMVTKKLKKQLHVCCLVDRENFSLTRLFSEVTLMYYFWVILQLQNLNFWNSYKRQLRLQYTQVVRDHQLQVLLHQLLRIWQLDNSKLKEVH